VSAGRPDDVGSGDPDEDVVVCVAVTDVVLVAVTVLDDADVVLLVVAVVVVVGGGQNLTKKHRAADALAVPNSIEAKIAPTRASPNRPFKLRR
jgi:hypothetical protein